MIHNDSKTEFEKHLFPGASIIELGDQLIDFGEKDRYMRSDLYWKEITSIDWHGKNRAIPLDLSTDFKTNLQGDILTDFGTCEHVTDLYMALLNCHKLTKDDGIMIHVNPMKGTYEKHGLHFFTQKFWINFSAVTGYELLSLYDLPVYEKSNPDREVFCTLRKKGNFISKELFETIEK